MDKIFETKTQQFFNDNRLVGAYYPNSKLDHLALYCLLADTNKSKILIKILDDYMDGIPEFDKILKKIKRKVQQNWLKVCTDNVEKNTPGWDVVGIGNRWNEYKKELEINLKKRKVSDKDIEDIIQYTEDRLL